MPYTSFYSRPYRHALPRHPQYDVPYPVSDALHTDTHCPDSRTMTCPTQIPPSPTCSTEINLHMEKIVIHCNSRMNIDNFNISSLLIWSAQCYGFVVWKFSLQLCPLFDSNLVSEFPNLSYFFSCDLCVTKYTRIRE